MKRRITLGALVCVLAIASHPALAVPPNPSVHGTDDLDKVLGQWMRMNDDGSETGIAASTTSGPQSVKINAQDKSGKPVDLAMTFFPTNRFAGHQTEYLRLPGYVRAKPTFINFFIHATPAADPDNGTIVNVDGAIIGFQQVVATDGSGILARIVVKSIDSHGKPVWQNSKIVLSLSAGGPRAVGVRLGVRLDPENSRWSLYLTDMNAADDIPLFAEQKDARLSIRAGLLDTDVVSISDLTVGPHPYFRSADYLPADANGHLDVGSARKEHDPRVHQ